MLAVSLLLIVAVVVLDFTVIAFVAKRIAVRLGLGELSRLVFSLIGCMAVLSAAFPSFYLGGWVGWGSAAAFGERLNAPDGAILILGFIVWMVVGGAGALLAGLALQALALVGVYLAQQAFRAQKRSTE
ncbi:MAG: hypothetical protein J0I28_02310 [Caulobacterales bacterium]|nr:hypothetical protein [Caulobacterales bacterium]